MVIQIIRPIPGRSWMRDKHCRVLAGCYETEPPFTREVYVRDQVGEILGWHYNDWENGEAVTAKVFVRVKE